MFLKVIPVLIQICKLIILKGKWPTSISYFCLLQYHLYEIHKQTFVTHTCINVDSRATISTILRCNQQHLMFDPGSDKPVVESMRHDSRSIATQPGQNLDGELTQFIPGSHFDRTIIRMVRQTKEHITLLTFSLGG